MRAYKALIILAFSFTTNQLFSQAAPFVNDQVLGGTGGDFEHVELSNGGVNLSIPVLNVKGRGRDFPFIVSYSSKNFYVFQTVSGAYWENKDAWFFSPGGFEGGENGGVGGVLDTCTDSSGTSYDVTVGTTEVHIYPDGSRKSFPLLNIDWPSWCVNPPQPPTVQYHSAYSTDLSAHVRAWCCGVTVGPENPDGSTADTDSNGNFVDVYCSYPSCLGDYRDTLGHVVVHLDQAPLGSPGTDVLTLGDGRQIKITWITTSANPGFTHPNLTCICSFRLISQILYPNGRSMDFEYANGTHGQLTKISLPTGGYIRYVYAIQPTFYFDPNVGWSDALVVTDRYVSPDGVQEYHWNYSYQQNADGTQRTTTETDPAGNVTLHTYVALTEDREYFETNSEYRSGATQAVKNVHKDWTCDQVPKEPYVTWPSGIWSEYGNCRVTDETTTMYGATNRVRKTHWDYDLSLSGTYPKQAYYYPQYANFTTTRGNVTKKLEYDWGDNNPGPLLRETDISYLTVNPQNGNLDYTSTAINIVNKPTLEVVKDGAQNIIAQTRFEYDGSSLTDTSGTQSPHHDYTKFGSGNRARGNLTKVSRWRNTDGAWLDSTYTYDDLGNKLSMTDPLQHATNFDYTDSWFDTPRCPPSANSRAYVTDTTNALLQHTHSKYFSCTGLVASAQDANDLQAGRTGTTYTYDNMNRPQLINYPDGGQTTYNYQDDVSAYSPDMTVQKRIDSRQTLSWTLFDGLGRAIRTAMWNGEGDPIGQNYYDQTDVCFDTLGQKAFISYPYRSTGFNAPYACSSSQQPGDTFTYDALNRLTGVTHSDGTVVRTDYSQFPTVIGTDEAGKSRRARTDGLGRITAVWEPNPSGGSGFPNETDYQYDALDNLLCMHQRADAPTADTSCSDPNVPSAWRPRVFTYSSLSQLLSSANPESGTITYGYDNAGNLTSKISPAPNQTGAATITYNYLYDALNRLTSRSATNQPTESYLYDAAPPDLPTSYAISNPIGRLVQTKSSTAVGDVKMINSYDVMGRTQFQLQYPNRTTSTLYQTSWYSYNRDGSLRSVNYPSGRVITYGYNQAQRPIWALDTNSVTLLANSAHYTAWGALSSVVDGNVTTSNFYNTRMQPCRISASTGTAPSSCTDSGNIGNVLDLKYDFQIGQADNGNVYGITNNKDGTRSQSFSYDSLNRLKQANTPNPANLWGTSYGYDIWGNLLTKATMAGYAAGDPPLSVSVDANNRVSAWCYDAAGNIVGSSVCPSFMNVYDGENRMTAATVGAVTTNYDYDADGRRVRKSGNTNTFYWRGQGSEVLEETNPTGTFQHDYVFFGGRRLSRLDSRPPAYGVTNVVSTQGLAGNVVVITGTAQSPYITVGARVFVTGLSTSTFLNDQIFSVLSVDNSVPLQVSFQVSFTHAPYNTTPDSGTVYAGGGAPPPIYHYFSDHLGSASVITDASGAIQEESDYYPFGGERIITDLLINNNYKFTGKERDPETGCDYFGARYYCNTIGRFITPDPSGGSVDRFNPQSWNLYSYSFNNPLRYVDPSGKWPTVWHERFIDAAFKNLNREQLQVIKNASARVDSYWRGGQAAALAYQHGMRAPYESAAEARAKTDKFIAEHEAKASTTAKKAGTVDKAALDEFGTATHPVADRTSPTHRGEQVWTGGGEPGVTSVLGPGGAIVGAIIDGTRAVEHERGEANPTEEESRQTIEALRKEYLKTFGPEEFEKATGCKPDNILCDQSGNQEGEVDDQHSNGYAVHKEDTNPDKKQH